MLHCPKRRLLRQLKRSCRLPLRLLPRHRCQRLRLLPLRRSWRQTQRQRPRSHLCQKPLQRRRLKRCRRQTMPPRQRLILRFPRPQQMRQRLLPLRRYCWRMPRRLQPHYQKQRPPPRRSWKQQRPQQQPLHHHH
jgi:hypothetical protein